MNTHRAEIACSVPPTSTFVAAGDEAFCRERLAKYVEAYPPGEFDTPIIMAVIDPLPWHRFDCDSPGTTGPTATIEDFWVYDAQSRRVLVANWYHGRWESYGEEKDDITVTHWAPFFKPSPPKDVEEPMLVGDFPRIPGEHD